MYGIFKCFVVLIVCAVHRTKCWTERTKSFQDLTCAQVANRIRIDKVVGSSPKLADITGQWVSEKCEIRAGPEFLLRKYIIFPSGRFQLFQFYFSDSDCHEPAFCIEARGRFTKGSYRRSWTIQGGTEADFEVFNVAVIAYTSEVAQALQRTVNGTCTTSGGRGRQHGLVKHRHRHRHHHVRHHQEDGNIAYVWQPWERYDLFTDDFEEPFTTERKTKKKKKKMLPNEDDDVDDRVTNTIDSESHGTTSDDIVANGFQSALEETTFENPSAVEWEDSSSPFEGGEECPPSSTLELSFNELQLMRIETQVSASAAVAGVRGNAPGIGPPSTKRLYLGDVHTDSRQRSAYRPRSYQDPLVAEDAQEAVSRCRVCRTVSESSEYYPPSLPLLAPAGHFPSISQLVSGSSWTSDRCETRPYGIFLTRRLTFGTFVASHSSKPNTGIHHHENGPVIGRDWWEERVQYFTDPACRNPYFAVYGRGRYAIGTQVPAYGRDVAYEADFIVTQLKVTVNDKRLLPVVKNCGGRRPTKGSTEVNEAVRNHELPHPLASTTGTDKWFLGVEMDVTASGGCRGLDVRMPTSPIPQLLAVVRRGGPGPNDVVLLVGQEPMEAVDDSYDEEDMKQQRRRPTSFNPGLRRCIDVNRPTSAAKSVGLSDFMLGGMKTSSIGSGSRRPWRHVTSTSSSSISVNDVIVKRSIVAVLAIKMASKFMFASS